MPRILPHNLQKETTPLTPSIWNFELPAPQNHDNKFTVFQVIQPVNLLQSL